MSTSKKTFNFEKIPRYKSYKKDYPGISVGQTSAWITHRITNLFAGWERIDIYVDEKQKSFALQQNNTSGKTKLTIKSFESGHNRNQITFSAVSLKKKMPAGQYIYYGKSEDGKLIFIPRKKD